MVTGMASLAISRSWLKEGMLQKLLTNGMDSFAQPGGPRTIQGKFDSKVTARASGGQSLQSVRNSLKRVHLWLLDGSKESQKQQQASKRYQKQWKAPDFHRSGNLSGGQVIYIRPTQSHNPIGELPLHGNSQGFRTDLFKVIISLL